MEDIYKILKYLNIEYVEHNHPAVFTCEEAQKYRKGIEGESFKNLFLRNKKGNKHFLLVTFANKQIDLKRISEMMKEKNLSFASSERLFKYLKLTPGSVSPFGLINDKKREVKVILDKEITKEKIFNFHPNINTATFQISNEDFKKFLKWCGNEVLEIEI